MNFYFFNASFLLSQCKKRKLLYLHVYAHFLYLFHILLKYYTTELKYSKLVGHKNAVYILLWKGMCIH